MNSIKFFHRLKVFDWIFLAVSIAVSALSFSVYARSSLSPVLVIESQGQKWVYNMEQTQDVVIQGSQGATHIHIENGKAFFTDSACNGRTCVAARPISFENEWIVCLPNNVFARIEGKTQNQEFDIISN